MPQPERGLPVPKSMNTPVGEATRAEKANDTDAGPIADRSIPVLTPDWQPDQHKDATLVPTGLGAAKLVVKEGGFPFPSAPGVLERVGPGAFLSSETLLGAGVRDEHEHEKS